MVDYQTVKKFEDMFTYLDIIHGQTDVQTDGQTPHNGIGRAYARITQQKTRGCNTLELRPGSQVKGHTR